MEKHEMVAVGLVLALILTGYFFKGGVTTSMTDQNNLGDTAAAVGGLTPTQAPATPTVAVQIVTPGTGATVKVGDRVNMHYVGTLESGQKFDSSRDRGTPFSFTLGNGEVIAGWEIGIMGNAASGIGPMQVGEKRILVIPSDLAYGDQGTPDGTIPPKATLVFEVELVSIAPGMATTDVNL